MCQAPALHQKSLMHQVLIQLLKMIDHTKKADLLAKQ